MPYVSKTDCDDDELFYVQQEASIDWSKIKRKDYRVIYYRINRDKMLGESTAYNNANREHVRIRNRLYHRRKYAAQTETDKILHNAYQRKRHNKSKQNVQ